MAFRKWHHIVLIVVVIVYLSSARGNDADVFDSNAKPQISHDHLKIVQEVRSADALNKKQITTFNNGEYLESEKLAKRMHGIYKKYLGSENSKTVAIQNNIAAIYFERGDFNRARVIFEKVLTIRSKILTPTDILISESMNNLAASYYALGLREESLRIFIKALEFKKRNTRFTYSDIATSLNNLAIVSESLGRYSDAIKHSKKALDIRLNNNEADAAQSLNNLGMLYLKIGNSLESRKYLLESYRLRTELFGGDHFLTAQSLNNLGTYYKDSKDFNSAQSYYEKAYRIWRKALGDSHPSTLLVVANLAENYLALGEWSEAQYLSSILLKYYLDNLDPIQQFNSLVTKDNHKTQLDRMKLNMKLSVRLLKNEIGDSSKILSDAWSSLQLAHDPRNSRVMIQSALKLAANDMGRQKQVVALESAMLRLHAADKRYVEIMSRVENASDSVLTKVKSNRDKSHIDVEEAYKSLKTGWKKFSDLVDLSPISVISTQALLNANEAILAYLSSKNESYLMVLRKDNISLHLLNIEVDTLKIKVGTLRNAMEQSKANSVFEPYDITLAHELYQKLVAPVRNELNDIEHLMIATDNTLQGLPFTALVTQPPSMDNSSFGVNVEDSWKAYSDAAWLIREFSISRLPSVATLKMMRHDSVRHHQAEEAFIGFGDPVLGKPTGGNRGEGVRLDFYKLFRGHEEVTSVEVLRKLGSLPGSSRELIHLAEAFKIFSSGRLFLNERATEEKLKQLDYAGILKRQQVIAFATHALQASESGGMAESGLVFTPPETPSKENDGYLTAIEVSRLKLNADWVLLSACNTGTVTSSEFENGQSDNLSSLAKSFFSAGSRNLLVTQWPVNDEAGSQLMSELFKDPDRHKGKALQQAMLKFIDHGIDRNNCPSGDWVCRVNAKVQGWVAQLSGDSQKAHSYTHPAYWAPYRILGSGE